jgi:hypothetical protein
VAAAAGGNDASEDAPADAEAPDAIGRHDSVTPAKRDVHLLASTANVFRLPIVRSLGVLGGLVRFISGLVGFLFRLLSGIVGVVGGVLGGMVTGVRVISALGRFGVATASNEPMDAEQE